MSKLEWSYWKWKDIVVDNSFPYNIAINILEENEDFKLEPVDEFRRRKWLAKMKKHNPSVIKFICKM